MASYFIIMYSLKHIIYFRIKYYYLLLIVRVISIDKTVGCSLVVFGVIFYLLPLIKRAALIQLNKAIQRGH